MTKDQEALLYLVRLGIGGNAEPDFSFEGVDWERLAASAMRHGVAAIAFDGLQTIMETAPEVEDAIGALKFKWMGYSISMEKEYSSYLSAVKALAEAYNSNGIKMLLLKGYGLSLDYPVPEHRPIGDIDIYNFGAWKQADELMERQYQIKIDRSHHHHTIFAFKHYCVENHYDFINTKAHKDSPFIESKLKELAKDSVEYSIDGTTFYIPSATFNAIFLIRHAAQHFAGEYLTLRQILDWGLFLEKHSSEVDWKTVEPFLKKIGIWKFFCVLNGICADYLGMKGEQFSVKDCDSAIETRVVNDILCPEFSEAMPSEGRIRVAIFRARRWWNNRWKSKLVYNEKLLPMLLTLAKSHIVSPKV